ncbi:MAG: SMI1/KNR4 family protein [Acidobacteria bacterium]|nr:SMI1/KNR4 family protein [Acidobacteriota bacterium]
MEADDQAFQPNAPASTEARASLRTALAQSLPESYFAFLARTNGGEGFIGARYVQLWRAEELAEMNRAYKTSEFFPNLFFIGSDGGGEAFAFDLSRTDAPVYEVPFIGLPTDARAIASSFDSFLATEVGYQNLH